MKSTHRYWIKDCDCEKSGCSINKFHVDGKCEGDMVKIIVTFAAYRCAHCGKPWKETEEEVTEP